MANKLNACPFCGSERVKVCDGFDVMWIAPKYRGKIKTVCCGSCGVNGGVFNTFAITEKEATKKAVDSWNRRV